MSAEVNDIIVRRAQASELPACLEVRRVVFIQGQDVPEALEVDGLDPECTHFLALAAGRPVGTARLRRTDAGLAKAERVAVLPAHQGRTIGARLMDALEAEARAQGFDAVVLSAQIQVVDFYARRGYVAEGPMFVEAGIDHRKMRLSWAGPSR